MTEPFRWATLSAIGAVRCYPTGRRLRWFLHLRRGTIRVPSLLAFLRALNRQRRWPVLLVWDRLPGHRSRLVRDFFADNWSRLAVEWLPPYSPQLNPTELLWTHLDATAIANTPSNNLAHLGRRTRRGVARVQAMPSISRLPSSRY